MTYLLDVNVLIALAWPTHIHHTKAHAWFAQIDKATWATCPLTQLAFVRISSNSKAISSAVSTQAAMQMLTQITQVRGHVFWEDKLALQGLACFESPLLVGHRQTTDAYLLELARAHKAKLATFDGGLAQLLKPNEVTALVELIG
jgi:uncharacterized protein